MSLPLVAAGGGRAPAAGDRDARYPGQETGGVHFAPEGDSFLLAVANAPPVFFFPVPPLEAHGNRAEQARSEAAHFAGDPRPTDEFFLFFFSPLFFHD
jgi:hypothetical protein